MDRASLYSIAWRIQLRKQLKKQSEKIYQKNTIEMGNQNILKLLITMKKPFELEFEAK